MDYNSDFEQGRVVMSERNYQWDAAEYAQHSSQQFKWACELTEKLHFPFSLRILWC